MNRDELIALVDKAHKGAAYAEATETGKTLAEHSKLPRLVAQNLGAGFGQWDFFPEPSEIVDFALAYVAPETPDDVMALAKTWASDDAKKRHTLMNLVGKEILIHELRRVDVPKLKELFDAPRVSRAMEVRRELGLECPAGAAAPPSGGSGAVSSKPAPKRSSREPVPAAEVPLKMPKPKFVKPPPKAAKAAPRIFVHPKFGEGVLEREDGTGEEMKLTVKFATGSKTLLAKFLTEQTPSG